MSAQPPTPREFELGSLAKAWPLLLALGVGLIVLGMAAIGSAFYATLTTMMVFGTLLVLGAAVEIVAALRARNWRGSFLHVLVGAVYAVAGLFMVEHPVEAALGLTLLVAASLLISGIVRVVVSLLEQFDGWMWMALSGVVSSALGLAIWRQWPFSGAWVIGLFVGIEMVFSGVSWVMLGLATRMASKATTSA